MLNEIQSVNEKYVKKWQQVLRLQNWEIVLFEVNKDWEKDSDIQISENENKAVLMVNIFNASAENAEALIIYELLHLTLWEQEYILDDLLGEAREKDKDDPNYYFTFKKFMEALAPYIEELANRYLDLAVDKSDVAYKDFFKRIEKGIEESNEL